MIGQALRSIALRLGILAIVWVAATEADAGALVYAPAGVPIAVVCSYCITGMPWRTRRGAGVSWREACIAVFTAAELVAWVLGRSVLGAIDVSRRALWLPRPDIDPEWQRHEIQLEAALSRAAFSLIMNLMPGTLTARLDGNHVDLHVISPSLDIEKPMRRLTVRLARIERALRVAG